MPTDSTPSPQGTPTPGTRTCEHPGTHHSDDMVEVWHGDPQPIRLCGYHASTLGPWTYDVVREARRAAAAPPTHPYTCSNHDDARPALEVHAIAGPATVAYCADCAPMMRPYAHVVWSADLAHALGVQVTL